MKAVGLTHGTFYAHFDSKEDLMIAATEYAMQDTLQGLIKHFGTDSERMAYVAKYLSRRHKDNPGTGCAMAGLSGEVRHELEVKNAFTVELKKIVAAVDRDRYESIRMVSALVGAMILARAVSDEVFSEEILDAVRQEFAGLASGGRKKQSRKKRQ